MSYGHRELLWLLALAPLTLALSGWFWRRRLLATRQWVSPGLWKRLRFQVSRQRLAASLVLLSLAVAGVGLGLAQPRWGEAEDLVERRGVDIVFLLDSSLSMSAEDVSPSRLYVAKALIRSLVRSLPGNRVALVQAEGEGVVMSPLTVDAAVIDLLLDTAVPGSLPRPGTGLAHGLDLALQLFPEESEKHRALVVLSDGEDHEGGVTERLDRLEQEGVVVHALGIATHEGGTMPIRDGGTTEPKRDREGRVVVTRLEEDVLRHLAENTGGLYRQVTSAGADLSGLVGAIEKMETQTYEGSVHSSLEDRFQWPLGVAATLLAAFLAFAPVADPRREARS
jgi:Ca-activated chloride channel family protein